MKIKKRKVEVTRVFDENEMSKALVLVNRGGARSTKSYSIAQLIITRLTNEHKKAFLVVRKTMPALRITAYKLMIDLLTDYGFYPFCQHNKTENIIKYSDNFILFTSIEYVSRIKSSEWNYIWMEEADEFSHEDFQILKMRLSGPTSKKEPNQIFLSFNPVDAYSWLKTEVIEKEPDVQDIRSTYHDNPFLSKEYVKIIEGLEDQDQNLWRVYGKGEWGILENLIFHNWDVVRKWPEEFDYNIYGLDFGFNNPSALVEVGVKDEEVWVRQHIYKTELTNPQLIQEIDELKLNKSVEMYADSAEPARIEEFYQDGYNIFPANKEVWDGIEYLKRLVIHIYYTSSDLIKEVRGYKYKTDKAGHILDEPVKFNDHLIDAFRYARFSWYNIHEKGSGGRVRFI